MVYTYFVLEAVCRGSETQLQALSRWLKIVRLTFISKDSFEFLLQLLVLLTR